jgi:dephospho-CoA kinase
MAGKSIVTLPMGINGNLVVGLTGGMGCGKSTAAALFVECGFTAIDTDRIVREQLLPDPAVAAAIRERFGPAVAAPDGSILRDRLADIVFRDEVALGWLENLLHPGVRAHCERVITARHGAAFIVEVPLLFEKGLENWFDFTVCVTADSRQQLHRLQQRGIPPELASQRIARQLPLTRKCELAGYVLLNDGSVQFLREQVRQLAAQFSKASTA